MKRTTECIYCGKEEIEIINQDPNNMGEPTEIIPDVDDDAAWSELAALHHDGCEWIATRAHQHTGE